jgi:hypothetical protein
MEHGKRIDKLSATARYGQAGSVVVVHGTPQSKPPSPEGEGFEFWGRVETEVRGSKGSGIETSLKGGAMLAEGRWRE